MTRSIGGVLDQAAYSQLAQLHRPTDAALLAAEVHRMHQRGLTAKDISEALRLALDQVINVLAGQGIA